MRLCSYSAMDVDARATLRYLSRACGPAAGSNEPLVFYPHPAGSTTSEAWPGDYCDVDVCIANARHDASRDGLHLDKQGYVLLSDGCVPLPATPHTDDPPQPDEPQPVDFFDDQSVERVWLPQVRRALLSAMPGARDAIMFDTTRRSDDAGVRVATGVREPAPLVHNDYTARSGPARLADAMQAGVVPAALGEAALAGKRFAIVNLWRSSRHRPVFTAPLAVCDARSVDAVRDLAIIERRSTERTGHIHVAYPNTAHKWAYFPELQPHEAIAFKTYDSSSAGHGCPGSDTATGADDRTVSSARGGDTACFALHTSFKVSTVHNDALAPESKCRESIEARVFVFF